MRGGILHLYELLIRIVLFSIEECLEPQLTPVPTRRVSIHEDGRPTPLVPHLPLLSSANQPWEGFLLEQHASEGFEVPKHDHSAILLSMQLSASLRLDWRSGRGAGSAQVDAGSLTLHGRGSCDRSLWTGSYDRLLFELDPLQLERLTEGRFPGGRIDVAERWIFKDPRIEYLLRTLQVELKHGVPAGKLFGEQVGNTLAMLLAGQYAVIAPGVYATRGRLPKSRLIKVYEYVGANLSQDISLSALAETAGMSPYYFARLFKLTTGTTPHQYVVQRRIERAKQLLRDPSISVFEVGIRVGYLDPKHFRELFRREVRTTPTNYRSKL
jgi:AraC family transcriptional regulator